ncbi:MAG: hypothetical protein FJ147_01855 [Deltaproteobacteria bacterium]|nr:hypothetical protein [Deltaproteobacteria bacterium]
MEPTSTIQTIKLFLVALTGLSKDALHVHVGLGTMLGAAMVFRRAVRSFLPWLMVLLAAVCGEMLDMYDDIIGSPGYWQWEMSVHDIANTLFWPTILLLLARSGVWSRMMQNRRV